MRIATLVLALTAMSLSAFAQDPYSPHVDRSHTTHVYWGDTHVHTALSSDAFIFGTRLLPDDAYRFAKGEKIRATSGQEVRLRRPLDFLMVSDHAENVGVIARIHVPLRSGPSRPTRVQPRVQRGDLRPTSGGHLDGIKLCSTAKVPRWSRRLGHADYGIDARFYRSVWKEVVASAERHNDPGRFTTFSGYEWTVAAGGHRNVIFADGLERASQIVPFSAFDSSDPEDLWAYLQDYGERTAGQAFAIPHNGNLSGNRMFALTTFQGEPLTETYARTRSRFEPLYEVTQTG